MIKIEKSSDEQFREKILDGIVENNKRKCEWFRNNSEDVEDKYDNFLVFDEEKFVGGAVGYILYEWYFLELLWILDEYQGQGIGTSIIKKIEDFAIKENLVGIRLETWNFQAKGFYEKMGYEVYATILDCPPGTINYFFKKRLK